MVRKSRKHATILPAGLKRKESEVHYRATCGTCPSDCDLNVAELEEINVTLQKGLYELEASKKEWISRYRSFSLRPAGFIIM